MKNTHIRTLGFTTSLLMTALAAELAIAQDGASTYLRDLKKAGTSTEGSAAAVSRPSTIAVSKTAFLDGQNVCGVIRITNSGRTLADIGEHGDSLEVHFPSSVSPPPLPAGSTRNWFRVAFVPVALPDKIQAGETVVIDYCFPLCQAADFAGANSMRNVITVAFTTAPGRATIVTTRSVSFPPPTLDCRACCLPNGSCTDTVPADCQSQGGTPQAVSSGCATTECTQACCRDGACSDETLSACQIGGEPLGLGTDCVTTTCRGACCVFEGCFDGASLAECTAQAGSYLGNDTTCAAATATTCPTGACCAAGICRDASTNGISISQLGCEQAGGGYLGDGSTCATVNTTCVGACCTDSGCIDGFSVDQCAFFTIGGISSTYLGNDTTCAATATTTCPTGACCRGGTCSDGSSANGHYSQTFCENNGGGYLGDGSTCATANTTCIGACCIDSGCIDGLSVEACALFGFAGITSTYLGNDTTCAAAATTTCPTGACCSAGTCLDVSTGGSLISESACEQSGGGYLGNGSTCATANTSCVGACCTDSGCFDGFSVEQCAFFAIGGISSTYLGNDTTCTSTSCTEACCFGTDCQELLPGECTTQGGQSQGPGTGCPIFGPTPCDVIDH